MSKKAETLRFIDVLNEGKSILRDALITDWDIDAWLLFSEAFNISKAEYFMKQFDDITDDDAYNIYRQWLLVRCRHIPLQHITGHQEFMGFDFTVNEHTLIPRQDTETLVEQTLAKIKEMSDSLQDIKVLDMCTGTGCIGLSLAKICPDIKVTLVDISVEALKVTKINKEKLEVSNAEIIQSDLFANIGNNIYNIIVSNPPYIRSAEIHKLSEEVKNHDPILALDGSEDGLMFYEKITKEAKDHLGSGGYLLYEIGFDQSEDVSIIMSEEGFTDIITVKDLTGKDRVVVGKISDK